MMVKKRFYLYLFVFFAVRRVDCLRNDSHDRLVAAEIARFDRPVESGFDQASDAVYQGVFSNRTFLRPADDNYEDDTPPYPNVALVERVPTSYGLPPIDQRGERSNPNYPYGDERNFQSSVDSEDYNVNGVTARVIMHEGVVTPGIYEVRDTLLILKDLTIPPMMGEAINIRAVSKALLDISKFQVVPPVLVLATFSLIKALDVPYRQRSNDNILVLLEYVCSLMERVSGEENRSELVQLFVTGVFECLSIRNNLGADLEHSLSIRLNHLQRLVFNEPLFQHVEAQYAFSDRVTFLKKFDAGCNRGTCCFCDKKVSFFCSKKDICNCVDRKSGFPFSGRRLLNGFCKGRLEPIIANDFQNKFVRLVIDNFDQFWVVDREKHLFAVDNFQKGFPFKVSDGNKHWLPYAGNDGRLILSYDEVRDLRGEFSFKRIDLDSFFDKFLLRFQGFFIFYSIVVPICSAIFFSIFVVGWRGSCSGCNHPGIKAVGGVFDFFLGHLFSTFIADLVFTKFFSSFLGTTTKDRFFISRLSGARFLVHQYVRHDRRENTPARPLFVGAASVASVAFFFWPVVWFFVSVARDATLWNGVSFFGGLSLLFSGVGFGLVCNYLCALRAHNQMVEYDNDLSLSQV